MNYKNITFDCFGKSPEETFFLPDEYYELSDYSENQFSDSYIYNDSENLSLAALTEYCDEFETIMAYISQETDDENAHIRFRKLLDIFLHYAKTGQIKNIERKFREYNIFGMLSDIIALKKIRTSDTIISYIQSNEDMEEEEDQSDQDTVYYSLLIALECSKRSFIFLREILQRGILINIKLSFNLYKDHCKKVAIKLFQLFFLNKLNIGEISFAKFIIKLAKKYLEMEKFDEDEEKFHLTRTILEVLFSLPGYKRLSSDENTDYKMRHVILQMACFIFSREYNFFYSACLPGLADLVETFPDFYFCDLCFIQKIFNQFINASSTHLNTCYLRFFISLYKNLPKSNNALLQKYEMITDSIMEKFIQLIDIDPIINFTLSLYETIFQVFPKTFPIFNQDKIINELMRILYSANFNIKIRICEYLSIFFIESASNRIEKYIESVFFDSLLELLSIHQGNIHLYLNAILISLEKSPTVKKLLEELNISDIFENFQPSNEADAIIIEQIFNFFY